MVLLIVLVVVALLSLAGLTFSELMLAEREAAWLSGRQAQTRALCDSGVDAARLFLAADQDAQAEAGGWYDNPDRFRGVLVLDDASPRGRGRFTLVAPRTDDAGGAGVRFGLQDESTRLNLNALVLADKYATNGGRQLLMALPGMTEETADAIMDWIDADDEARESGAEIDYYSTLDPPYATKNGPLETVEELLLVRGVTPELLFGGDANHNGYLDPNETAPASVVGLEGDEHAMDCGWAAYLTLYSLERNTRPDGTPKIYLNQDDIEKLYQELEEAVGPDWATFIVGYRQNGEYTGTEQGQATPGGQPDLSQKGKTTLTTVLDLLGKKVRMKLQGQQDPVVLESPFPDVPGVMAGYLPILMDNLTASSSPLIPGRININQAPRAVLAGIPGMTPEILEEIITRRTADPAQAEPRRRHETWILEEGICSLDEMKALMPFVTGGGSVYRAQVVGYYEEGGPAAREEVILDATASPPRVLFWRDMSHLGRGYPLETLGVQWTDDG